MVDNKGKANVKKKRRLILNLKAFGVIGASFKAEKPELPRVLDIIFAGLELLRHRRCRRNWLRHLALDFRSAFFQFPARRDEQRFFATVLRRHVYVWNRAVQGSPNAAWGPIGSFSHDVVPRLASGRCLLCGHQR